MKKKQKVSPSEDFILPRLVDYNGDVSQRWYIIYYVKNVATGHLKRKRYTSINDSDTATGRWKEARKACNDITKMLKEGCCINEPESIQDGDIDPSKTTFIEALKWAIEKKKLDVGTLQAKDYKTLINHITQFLQEKKISTIPLSKVNSTIIVEFFDWFKKKGRAKKTFNNIHTNFHALYELLIRRKVTHENLCKQSDKLRAERGGKHMPFTQEQIESIYAKMIEKREFQLLFFVQCVYYLFLRPVSELRFLKSDAYQERYRICSTSHCNEKENC